MVLPKTSFGPLLRRSFLEELEDGPSSFLEEDPDEEAPGVRISQDALDSKGGSHGGGGEHVLTVLGVISKTFVFLNIPCTATF